MSEVVAKLNQNEIETFKKFYKGSDNYRIADSNWSERSRELAKKFLETNWGIKLIIKSTIVKDPEKQAVKLKFLIRGASYYTNNKDANMELMYLDAPGLFRFIKNTFHE
jgi:hypothetical protein